MNFQENILDFYLTMADAFNGGRASLHMTPSAYENLIAQVEEGSIFHHKNGTLMYKYHPIIFDETLNSNKVIKIPSLKEDFYYSWY